MTRYQRRPERPRPNLDSPDWQQRLASVESWIREIIDTDEQRLHVGAIWGRRGTGKSSFLHNLHTALLADEELKSRLRLANRAPQAKAKQRPPLFAPDLIDDSNGDHLFTHFLHFLRGHCFPINATKALKKPLKLLTRHHYHDDFKNFESETATTSEELEEELYKRLGSRSTFSLNLRDAIKASIGETNSQTDSKWFLVLVDDIDLVPHRGPELLELLHLYLRDLPFIILLAADREQLVEHTGVHLHARYGRPDHGLALQFVAKQVPYEWEVPHPSPEQRVLSLFDENPAPAPEPNKEYVGPKLKVDFGKQTAELLRFGWSRLHNASEAVPEWVNDPTTLLGTFLAPRWRAVNRTYNRLATLHERLAVEATFQKELVDSLGVPEKLVRPALALVVAFDESHPQLALWEAIVRAPKDVLQSLTQLAEHEYAAPESEESTPPYRDSPSGPLALLDQKVERVIDIIDQRLAADHFSTMGAPLDRLRPPWLDGRERNYARATLQKLLAFFDVARRAGNVENLKVLALSAVPSEQTASEELASYPNYRVIEPLDLRSDLQGDRPSASQIRDMVKQLRSQALPTEVQAVYLRTPLSLATWVGWYTRQRPGPLAALGLYSGELINFSVPTDKINRRRTEPLLLQQPIELTFATPPENTQALADEALLVLDVRDTPETSSRALPLWRDGELVYPEHSYKLASSRGFQLTQENIADTLSDILWLVDDLRHAGVKRFHLALACPAPLAFFIGGGLNSFLPVDLYEYDPKTSSYHYVTGLE